MSLKQFFAPKSVAVVGVSQNPDKLGSVIFQNIIESKFKGKIYGVNPKMEGKKLKRRSCYASVVDIPKAVHLVVVVVRACFVMDVIDDCVKNKAKNVVIISAGFGEVGNQQLEKRITKKCMENNINLLGPNCLGVIFPYADLNASFSDGYPKQGNIAFISQSGAFCTAVLDWAEQKDIGFSHFVSLGNKAGVSEIELLNDLANDDRVQVFALYLESIKSGVKLLEAIKKISKNKIVIVLEPGESVAAQKASSSHTGSLAPNSVVVREAYKEAGAIQVFSMRDMFALLEMLTFAPHKNYGKRVAVITNAGGVGVLSSDLVEESHLELAILTFVTRKLLERALPAEAGLNNPIDIIGDARADRYEQTLQALMQDSTVEQILVLLTPQRTTEVEKTAEIIAEYAHKSDKNIVASFVGGEKVGAGIKLLRESKVPVFEFPSDAVRVMGLMSAHQDYQNIIAKDRSYKSYRISDDKLDEITKLIKEAKKKKLKSIPGDGVRQILTDYGFDVPLAEGFTDHKKAMKFAKKIFPGKVVMKISSPDAMHKTELKGVFLNVDNPKKFERAWHNLWDSIEIAGLKMASVKVQEQVDGGIEVIMGVNDDPNFGKIMVFGTGGIYTEVFHDTTIRILPSYDFTKMVGETKVGKILYGVRGEKPRAVDKLVQTMRRTQQFVTDFPMVKSIDANPVFVTEDRAVCVDFKIYI